MAGRAIVMECDDSKRETEIQFVIRKEEHLLFARLGARSDSPPVSDPERVYTRLLESKSIGAVADPAFARVVRPVSASTVPFGVAFAFKPAFRASASAASSSSDFQTHFCWSSVHITQRDRGALGPVQIGTKHFQTAVL